MLNENIRSKVTQALRLKDTVGFVWRSSPRFALANSILTLIQGALPLAPLYLMKLVVDAVTYGAGGRGASFMHVLGLLVVWAGVML